MIRSTETAIRNKLISVKYITNNIHLLLSLVYVIEIERLNKIYV